MDMMKLLDRLWKWIFPDRRSVWEKEKEKQFIQAVNDLQTLIATPQGGMSIDPEEIRDQIIERRELYKHLVDPRYRKHG